MSRTQKRALKNTFCPNYRKSCGTPRPFLRYHLCDDQKPQNTLFIKVDSDILTLNLILEIIIKKSYTGKIRHPNKRER